MRAGISEARTKKMQMIRRLPPRRWQVQTPHPTLNPRQTLKEKSGGERVLLWPERFRPRHQPPATFFNGSLEYTRDRHLRRRLGGGGAGAGAGAPAAQPPARTHT